VVEDESVQEVLAKSPECQTGRNQQHCVKRRDTA
jgi:hypothetical protein